MKIRAVTRATSLLLGSKPSETLQILRNLLLLLMPKEEDGGPKLVDLIAELVAEQRVILIGIKRLQSDMNVLFGRLDGKTGGDDQGKFAG